MRHVTYEWVISHMNKSCHIRMSHVTYEWVMSHTNESCHIWMSHVTYERVMSHMNESHPTWTSHVTYAHLEFTCCMVVAAITTLPMSHVIYWVMSHMNESSHNMNESRHAEQNTQKIEFTCCMVVAAIMTLPMYSLAAAHASASCAGFRPYFLATCHVCVAVCCSVLQCVAVRCSALL